MGSSSSTPSEQQAQNDVLREQKRQADEKIREQDLALQEKKLADKMSGCEDGCKSQFRESLRKFISQSTAARSRGQGPKTSPQDEQHRISVQTAMDDATNSVRQLCKDVLEHKEHLDDVLASDFKALVKSQTALKRGADTISQLGTFLIQLEKHNFDLGKSLYENDKPAFRRHATTIRAILEKIKEKVAAMKTTFYDIDELLSQRTERIRADKQKLAELQQKVEDARNAALGKAAAARSEWYDKAKNFAGAVLTAAIAALFTVCIAIILAVCIFVPGGFVCIALLVTLEVGAIVAVEAAWPILLKKLEALKASLCKEHIATETAEKHDAVLKQLMVMATHLDASEEATEQMQVAIKKSINSAAEFEHALASYEERLKDLMDLADIPDLDLRGFKEQYEDMTAGVQAMKQVQTHMGEWFTDLVHSCNQWEHDLRFQEQELEQLLPGRGVDWQYYRIFKSALHETPVPPSLESALEPMQGLILQEMHRRRDVYDQDGAAPDAVSLASFSAECGQSFSKAYSAEHIPVYSAASVTCRAPSRLSNGTLSDDVKKCLPFYKGFHYDTSTGLFASPEENIDIHRGILHKFSEGIMGANLCFFEPKSASAVRAVAEEFATKDGTILTFKLTKSRRLTDSFFRGEDERVIPMLSFFKVKDWKINDDGPDEMVLWELTDSQLEDVINKEGDAESGKCKPAS